MSERIEIQAGTTVGGAGGDAVRREGPALLPAAARPKKNQAAHPQLHPERHWRCHMAAHDWYQHVEISDGGRTVAAAEVIISGGTGGTARASLRAESGHIAPGRRASLVDAVLDLPAVRESARLAAVFPLGDSESLHRLEQRCRGVRTRPAGSTAILEADLQPGDDGRAAQDPVGEADPEG
jgi:hypothetical protein